MSLNNRLILTCLHVGSLLSNSDGTSLDHYVVKSVLVFVPAPPLDPFQALGALVKAVGAALLVLGHWGRGKIPLAIFAHQQKLRTENCLKIFRKFRNCWCSTFVWIFVPCDREASWLPHLCRTGHIVWRNAILPCDFEAGISIKLCGNPCRPRHFPCSAKCASCNS